MYPSPVLFKPAVPGARGLRLTWAPLDGQDIHSYVVFRSPRPIAAGDTERFYARLLDFPVRQERLHPHVCQWDDAPFQPIDGVAYYLVLASTQRGDLLVVPFEATARDPVPHDELPEPPAIPATTDSPPELVFREDDPMALVKMDAIASSLSALERRPR